MTTPKISLARESTGSQSMCVCGGLGAGPAVDYGMREQTRILNYMGMPHPHLLQTKFHFDSFH